MICDPDSVSLRSHLQTRFMNESTSRTRKFLQSGPEGTNFGHLGFGPANFGKNQFWPKNFGQSIWIWVCVSWRDPKGGGPNFRAFLPLFVDFDHFFSITFSLFHFSVFFIYFSHFVQFFFNVSFLSVHIFVLLFLVY